MAAVALAAMPDQFASDRPGRFGFGAVPKIRQPSPAQVFGDRKVVVDGLQGRLISRRIGGSALVRATGTLPHEQHRRARSHGGEFTQ